MLWVTAGIGYAGAMLLAPMLLRADPDYGFFAIVLLFAVVWTTDVHGLFRRPRHRRAEAVPGGQPEEDLVGRGRRRLVRHAVAFALSRAAAIGEPVNLAVIAA